MRRVKWETGLEIGENVLFGEACIYKKLHIYNVGSANNQGRVQFGQFLET